MASLNGYIAMKGVLIWTVHYLLGCLFHIFQHPNAALNLE